MPIHKLKVESLKLKVFAFVFILSSFILLLSAALSTPVSAQTNTFNCTWTGIECVVDISTQSCAPGFQSVNSVCESIEEFSACQGSINNACQQGPTPSVTLCYAYTNGSCTLVNPTNYGSCPYPNTLQGFNDCKANIAPPPPVNPPGNPLPLVTPSEDRVAIPPPVVPCLEQDLASLGGPGSVLKNPEFHSLRPYQASPCRDAPKAYFCSNDYQIIEKVNMKWDEKRCSESGGNYICIPKPNTLNSGFIIGGESILPNGQKKLGRDYRVDLADVDFPILGNTQNVLNSQQPNDDFDAAQKMSEYVNWYLQGITEKAEYGNLVPDNFVSFAGPAKKMLPFDILNLRRLEVLHDAGVKPEAPVDLETYQGPLDLVNIDPTTGEATTEQTLLHNQIAVCTENGEPVPCYSGTGDWEYPKGKAADGKSKRRLVTWWESRGSLQWETYYVSENDRFKNWTGAEIWGGTTPPFPWQFKNGLFYQKAYREWRGDVCTIVLSSLLCIPNPFGPGELVEMYRFIPLGNANDKNASHKMTQVIARAPGETEAKVISFDFPFEKVPVLHYPHTESTVQVSEILNQTHTPLACDENGKCKKIKGPGKDYELTTCEFVDVRVNPGDDLTFTDGVVKTYFDVRNVATQVNQIECTNKGDFDYFFDPNKCNGIPDPASPDPKCRDYPTCKAEVYVTLPSYPKIPYAKQIWENTVINKTSPVRRLFPKFDENAPISCIKEIPGVSKVTYTAGEETNLFKVTGPSNRVYGMGGTGGVGELFFPHLGTIHEYFLRAIQTALRPLGYGGPIASGEGCINCEGIAPEFTASTESCAPTGSSLLPPLPDNFMELVNSAGTAFQVPGNLILGVLYGEGIFNGGSFRGEAWSEENVNAWMTCTPLPNCTDSQSGLIYMGQNDWNDLANDIKPEVAKLYPDGLPEGRPNPCNLVDAIYAVSNFLDKYQTGSPTYPNGASCLNTDLNQGSGGALTCQDWDKEDFITAIRFWEFGACYGPGCAPPEEFNFPNPNGILTCATREDSCFGINGNGENVSGYNAQCPLDSSTDWDSCPSGTNNHTECVFDVSQGK